MPFGGSKPIALLPTGYSPYEGLQATFEPTCDASQYPSRIIQIQKLGKTVANGKIVPQIFMLLIHPLESPGLIEAAKLEKRGREFTLYKVE